MNIKELYEKINDTFHKICAIGVDPEEIEVKMEMGNLRTKNISIKYEYVYKFPARVILYNKNAEDIQETNEKRLHKALLAIIGVATEKELLHAKDLIELTKSDANRAAILNAIDILLDTMPKSSTPPHF